MENQNHVTRNIIAEEDFRYAVRRITCEHNLKGLPVPRKSELHRLAKEWLALRRRDGEAT